MSTLSDEMEFQQRNEAKIESMRDSERLNQRSREWLFESIPFEYSYHFTWLGRPIIQYPQDMVAIQELIWTHTPDLVVEMGIARGGSLIFSASIQHLLNGNGRVLGIDIDIREHNRKEIENHPMAHRIDMIQGSSIDPAIVAEVLRRAEGKKCLVLLDSMHTHEHVLAELHAYSPLVRKGGHLVVFDTCIEDFPKGHFKDRPWDKGNSPKTAVREFLRQNERFEIDRALEAKLQITVAPEGYLRCIKD